METSLPTESHELNKFTLNLYYLIHIGKTLSIYNEIK